MTGLCPAEYNSVVSGGFGGLLRAHRAASGLSQEGLAERAGVSPRAVSDLERGAAGRPRLATARRLAHALALEGDALAAFLSQADPARAPPGPGFGALLRRHRRARGLTQEQLARRALVSVRAVSDLERGLHRSPRGATLELLADALELAGAERTAFEDAGRLVRDPVAAPAERPGALPSPLRGLVGRDEELAAVLALLGAGQRLVTLTGPGGVGKTRLAIAVAHAWNARGGTAVWVPLADLRRGDEVLPAVAAALGVPEGARDDPPTALVAALPARDALLVLDNHEHLIAAASQTAALADAAPSARVLVTSRERLHVRDEHEQEVGPLALPDPGGRRLLDAPAPRLFLERAAAARARWEPSGDEAAVIAEICARLDGLPLALELCASWMAVLSPREVLVRLAAPLDVAVEGERDRPARHRSLRAAMDWSHELLEPAEQVLFRRLAVFAAPWTVEAAEVVCRSPGAPAGDVLHALRALEAKSLVHLAGVADADGGLLFAFLDTVRQYAGERLAASGEAAGVAARHAAWAADFAAAAAPRLVGEGQGRWLDRLAASHADLRAALAGVLAAGDAATAVRLGAALWRFWYLRGHLREGLAGLEDVLALDSAGAEPADLATARYGAGVLAYLRGDTPQAVARWDAALADYRALGDLAGRSRTANNLGMAAQYRGDAALAARWYDRGLADAREAGDDRSVAVSLGNVASLAVERGDLDEADARLREALALFRRLGDERSAADQLATLADLALRRGDTADAAARSREALAAFRGLGDRQGQADVLQRLVRATLAEGRWMQARAHLAEAAGLVDELGDPWGAAACTTQLARVLLAAGDAGGARQAALDAAARHRELEHAEGEREARAIEREAAAALDVEPPDVEAARS